MMLHVPQMAEPDAPRPDAGRLDWVHCNGNPPSISPRPALDAESRPALAPAGTASASRKPPCTISHARLDRLHSQRIREDPVRTRGTLAEGRVSRRRHLRRRMPNNLHVRHHCARRGTTERLLAPWCVIERQMPCSVHRRRGARTGRIVRFGVRQFTRSLIRARTHGHRVASCCSKDAVTAPQNDAPHETLGSAKNKRLRPGQTGVGNASSNAFPATENVRGCEFQPPPPPARPLRNCTRPGDTTAQSLRTEHAAPD